ncbi:hydrogenase formation protein HypD, partial [Proteus mirabilis]
VTGFEPLDLLQAILMVVKQLKAKAENADYVLSIENQYSRIVPNEGNKLAQKALKDVFMLKESSEWRGLGEIPMSGIQLTPAYAEFDAERRFTPAPQQVADNPQSRCGDVLTGRCKPSDCPLFGKSCTPETALGALMVSSEGACAAYYQYRREGNI